VADVLVIFSIIVLLIVACVTYFFVYKSVRKNHPIEFHKELYWGEIIVKTESHQGEIIGKTAGVTCGVAILLFLIGWVIHQYKLAERRRLLRTHCCLNCGYDLTGNVSGVCPECGEKA
jgi:multisubunit Na+/H+ antiporter MnhB subunit